MKKIFILIFCTIFLFCCKSQHKIGKKEVEKILDRTISVFNEKRGAIGDKDFLILSSVKIRDTAFYKNGKYGIGITVMSSKLTQGLKYKQLYSYKGHKVVLQDSLNVFKPLLTSIAYIDVNKSNLKELNYDPFNATLIFDKNWKILYVFPEDYKNYYGED